MSNRIITLNGEPARRIGLQEGPMLKTISTYMNTLRSMGVIPNWYNFIHHDSGAWSKLSRDWSGKEKTKFAAWWNGIYRLTRDKNDTASIGLFIAYLIAEMARRNNSQVPNVFPAKYGVTDNDHATRILEYVRSNYEALAPEIGINPAS